MDILRRSPRRLTQKFKQDLLTGILSGLRQVVLLDRDLLLEIRPGYIDIYFKGNALAKIEPLKRDDSKYIVSAHVRFTDDLGPLYLESVQEVNEFLNRRLPNLKHRISTHRNRASEIEVEHLLIRMNNRERGVNSEYFAVDRQGVYGSKGDRIDILGVYWPRGNRGRSKKLSLCVMEVKLAMGAGVGEVADQLSRYHRMLDADIAEIVADAQALLEDKIDLGLIGTEAQRERLKQLKISNSIDDVRYLLILAEQNPFSKAFDPGSLNSLPLKNVEVFRVGFGLWSCDAYTLQGGRWARPAAFPGIIGSLRGA